MSNPDELDDTRQGAQRKVDTIQKLYRDAFDATESFQAWPELASFLVYACGVIALHDGGDPIGLWASEELIQWLEDVFNSQHPLWGYVQVEGTPEDESV